VEYARTGHPFNLEEIRMPKSPRKLLTAAAVALSLAGLATASFADTAWQRHHPRRVEVNRRLANQNRRIREERKEGEINGRQAARLHREDRAIRREERAMARTNGGHLTKAEQHALNQQENQVSRQIGK
jgi:hypothetical protein